MRVLPNNKLKFYCSILVFCLLVAAALPEIFTSHAVGSIQTLQGQNGWRMEGYDGTFSFSSPAIGPAQQPVLETLIQGTPDLAILWIPAIADDGSLIIFAAQREGGVLSSYTRDGQLKWSFLLQNSLYNAIIGPSGKIYLIEAGLTEGINVRALNQNTGQLLWTTPFTELPGVARFSVTADESLILGGHTTEPSSFPNTKIIVLNSDGSIRWQKHAWSEFILNSSGSIVYTTLEPEDPGRPIDFVVGLSMADGQVAINWLSGGDSSYHFGYAPWGRLYADVVTQKFESVGSPGTELEFAL